MNTKNKASKKTKKKGVYYALDGFLAGMLIAGVAIMLLQTSFYQPRTDHKTFASQDILNALGTLTIGEVNSTVIQQDYLNGNITNLNKTVLEQIGEYWALNESSKAQSLFESVTNFNITKLEGMKVTIENDTIYSQGSNNTENVFSTMRMITGFSKGNPISGFSSSAYLKKIKNKKTSMYAYFGGFTGQGNITEFMTLPADFNSSRLVSSELTVETPGQFYLYINDVQCNSLFNGTSNSVDTWTLDTCSSDFQSGKNNISLRFISTLNESYVAGGYLKATYTTDNLLQTNSLNYKRYTFPSIDGLINIYDSVSAQGLITDWFLNVSFDNIYGTYLTLGNETIFSVQGSNTTQNILITRNNTMLAPTEIPLRMGITNITNVTIVTDGLPADSFLVTDVSGSMNDCAIYQNTTQEYCSYDYKFWFWWFSTSCPYTGTCSADECNTGSSSTRNHVVSNQTQEVCTDTKLDLAKQADKLFVDTVLNQSTQHKIGLDDFSSDANPATNLTNQKNTLDNEIDTYYANGGTCSCCGLNKARDLLTENNTKNFLIFLSDGEPTAYCNGGLHDYTGTWDSSPYTQSKNDAIASAQEACNNNITVYAIGFGNAMSQSGIDTMKQIACNNSLYYNASNVSQLADIYKNISNDILLSANYSSQTVNIQGNYSTTHLLSGSYIDLYYTPITTDEQNKIDIVMNSQQFACTGQIDIPAQTTVLDAHVAIFSGNDWTKTVFVNGNKVYNLSEYSENYSILGDPFRVSIPSAYLIPGATNNISITEGSTPYNNSNCSMNNSLIYTLLINASTSRTNTNEKLEGCKWEIAYEDGTTSNVTIPSTYNGTNTCSYTPTLVSYDSTDSYDVAVYDLLKLLDFDNNKKIFVDINNLDLEIITTTIGNVPYLWGPSIIKINLYN